MESNSSLNNSDIPRPPSYRTPKKQEGAYVGDRFIPTRQDFLDTSKSSFTHKTPEVAAFEERLNNFTCKLTPYASKKPIRKNILFFGSPHKQLASVNLQKQFAHQKINKKPLNVSLERFRILDAPHVDDNFYNNILTWSTSERVSIALNDPEHGNTVHSISINAPNSGSTITSPDSFFDQKICSLASLDGENTVSGWDNGYIRLNQTSTEHAYHYKNAASSSPIRSIAVTSPQTIICGDTNGLLTALDFRDKRTVARCQISHNSSAESMQIPGLTYNDKFYLASGSNDNAVSLWDIRRLTQGPIHTHTTHKAAVKALAFWPNEKQYLISGGGTACGHLSLWNTTTNQVKYTLNTGSEITGIHCLQNDPRYFVTSHGYGDLSVKLWHIEKHHISLKTSYSNLSRSGQNDRALCLAGSPNTNDFATVTSTESLHFFKSHGLNTRIAQTNQLFPGLSSEFSERLVIR